MRVDLAEGVPSDRWMPLPAHDRVMVGGHTVWTGPFESPVVVAQPNRWGIVEQEFPSVECLVEADPLVTGHLPLPAMVAGFVDRTHRPIAPPSALPEGKRMLEEGQRLAKRLDQIKGLRVAATPFGRTIPLVTPLEAETLIAAAAGEGLVGIRALDGLGGGFALSVGPAHGAAETDYVFGVLRALLSR